MSVVSVETAIHHLRADADDELDIQHKLDAAQEIAEQFMGRRVYANYVFADAAANTALEDMDTLLLQKKEILSSSDSDHVKSMRLERVNSQMYITNMTACAIATNRAIEIAILLILGTLYEHREDVVIGTSIVRLPQAAEHRLQPYRIMGV